MKQETKYSVIGMVFGLFPTYTIMSILVNIRPDTVLTHVVNFICLWIVFSTIITNCVWQWNKD